MSNRRRLKVPGRQQERCTSCGRAIGRLDDALRLRTGQVICPACRQHGAPARAGCGHIVLPGQLVIRNEGGNADTRCPACAPEAAAAAGNLRLGMAPLRQGGNR